MGHNTAQPKSGWRRLLRLLCRNHLAQHAVHLAAQPLQRLHPTFQPLQGSRHLLLLGVLPMLPFLLTLDLLLLVHTLLQLPTCGPLAELCCCKACRPCWLPAPRCRWLLQHRSSDCGHEGALKIRCRRSRC